MQAGVIAAAQRNGFLVESTMLLQDSHCSPWKQKATAVAAAALISLCSAFPSTAAVQVRDTCYNFNLTHMDMLLPSTARFPHWNWKALQERFPPQTVPPQEASSLAKPLQQQSVNKGKIWLIFLAGATGLFGAAVAIEKNSTLFPAIAKANQAMAATKAAQKVSNFLHTYLNRKNCSSL